MLNEKSIYKSAFWSAIGTVFDRLTSLVLVIFIAPLGPANLGIFHLSLRVLYGIVKLLKVRRTAKLRDFIQDPKSLKFEKTAAFYLKAYFYLGSVVGIFFFFLIIFFAPLKSFAFLALAFPFVFINSYMLLLLQLMQRFKKVFIIQAVFVFVFQALYILIFIKILNFGIAAAFAGQLFMAIAVSIISFTFVFDRLNLLGFFQKINLKMFIRKKLSFANALYNTIFPILDILLVTLLFGFSASGQYIVLASLPLLINRIPTTLFGMFIHVAEMKTYKNEDITQISKSVFKWILIPTMPLLIIILLFPSEILSFLFHKTYIKDLGVAQILAISHFVLSFGWMAERILIAKDKKVPRIVSIYLFAFVFISLSLILALFEYGIFGIALAFLIASMLDVLTKYILVTKKTKVFFIGMENVKILSAGGVSSLTANIFFANNPILFLSLFLIIYFAILWITGVVRLKTFLEIKKII